MTPRYLPLIIPCPECRAECGISFEFLEEWERLLMDAGEEDLSEFDQAIDEAINGEHKHEHHIDEVIFPVPLSLDTKLGALVVSIWCPRCKQIRSASITLNYLTKLVEKYRKGDDFETPDQSPD